MEAERNRKWRKAMDLGAEASSRKEAPAGRSKTEGMERACGGARVKTRSRTKGRSQLTVSAQKGGNVCSNEGVMCGVTTFFPVACVPTRRTECSSAGVGSCMVSASLHGRWVGSAGCDRDGRFVSFYL